MPQNCLPMTFKVMNWNSKFKVLAVEVWVDRKKQKQNVKDNTIEFTKFEGF